MLKTYGDDELEKKYLREAVTKDLNLDEKENYLKRLSKLEKRKELSLQRRVEAFLLRKKSLKELIYICAEFDINKKFEEKMNVFSRDCRRLRGPLVPEY